MAGTKLNRRADHSDKTRLLLVPAGQTKNSWLLLFAGPAWIPPFRLHVLLPKGGNNTVAGIRCVGHVVDLGVGSLPVHQADLGNRRRKLKIRLKQTSQGLAKLRFLLFYEMSRRCWTIKQAAH